VAKKMLFYLGMLAASVAFVVFAPVAAGDPLPDNCTKERGEINCTTTTNPGGPNSADPPSANKTETEETKGSFNSSHPETTCTFPPPKGKCETTG
jgi:hypothetical protein